MIYVVVVVNLIVVVVIVFVDDWISLVWDMRLGKGSNTIEE
jgi:hypothetical protein